MLYPRIQEGYAESLRRARCPACGVGAEVRRPYADPPSPTLLTTAAADLLADLREGRDEVFRECFGPTTLVASYDNDDELLAVAETIDGQLTASIIGTDDDPVVAPLRDALALKAGRVLWNGWPTGVSVTYAQQHGGPYPATTAPTHDVGRHRRHRAASSGPWPTRVSRRTCSPRHSATTPNCRGWSTGNAYDSNGDDPRSFSLDPRARAGNTRARGRTTDKCDEGRQVRTTRLISAVDSHTEGMPTRVVTGGVGVLPGASMAERRLWFIENADDLRTLLDVRAAWSRIDEWAILQPPTRPDADYGVLFIEVVGLPPNVRPRHHGRRDGAGGDRDGAGDRAGDDHPARGAGRPRGRRGRA